jgi:hypothetical protein
MGNPPKRKRKTITIPEWEFVILLGLSWIACTFALFVVLLSVLSYYT